MRAAPSQTLPACPGKAAVGVGEGENPEAPVLQTGSEEGKRGLAGVGVVWPQGQEEQQGAQGSRRKG